MNIFCFVSRLIFPPSIPPLPFDVSKDKAMESAVSVTVAPDSGDTRKRVKLNVVPMESQQKYAE